MISLVCLSCSNSIQIPDEPFVGQYVKCEACHIVLEITWLFPITLDFLEEEKKSITETDQIEQIK